MENTKLKTVALADGTLLPKLGQGSWFSGENPDHEKNEIASVHRGIDQGMFLIDTAEGYGNGLAEKFLKKALADYERDKYFLLSKVEPQNAGRDTIFAHCDASLKRLGTDYLDLYLLHWRDDTYASLEEIVGSMEILIQEGKIRRWGVSNFDLEDMQALFEVPGGTNCMVNQVLYNIGSRGIEHSLLPWMDEHDVRLIAYSPMAHSPELRKRFLTDERLIRIGKKYDMSVYQLLLAFTVKKENVIAIPRHEMPEFIDSNIYAASERIADEDWAEIDRIYPAPDEKIPLEII